MEFLDINLSITIGHIIVWFFALFLERLLVKPQTHLKLWNFKVALNHFFLVTSLFYILLIITQKIVFTSVLFIALFIILIIINNAKYKSLQEPLVFSDYDYFIDAFRFPRLYIPFLGLIGLIGIILGISLVIYGYVCDKSIEHFFSLNNGCSLSVIWLLVSATYLILNRKLSKLATLNVKQDLNNFGFLILLWWYFLEYLKKPNINSKIDVFDLPKLNENLKPNLIAIQSESFFDPRTWNNGIKDHILESFDQIVTNSRVHGKVVVPAFGANTIRTEFSFLTGVAPDDMGAHKFSPYQIMSRKSFELQAFIHMLKNEGYYTVCIHPYYKKFYHRDVIFKKWQFDEFIDIKSFTKKDFCGAYVGDEAIAKKIMELMQKKTTKPIFIFAITMENHGPSNLEKISDKEQVRFYKDYIDEKYKDYDLSVYLRHLKNVDQMIKSLTSFFDNINTPVSMVFYGDHIPILTKAYEKIGIPDSKVPYFIWDNNNLKNIFLKQDKEININGVKLDLNIENLQKKWLNYK